jgi:hypothetical protein
LKLQKLNYNLTICLIGNIEQVDFSQEFVLLSKTSDEISLVCETEHAPFGAIKYEPGWKALRVSGTLDFDMIGVIAGISRVLAEIEVSIFVVSTYNTDYVLIKSKDFDKGINALERNGYSIS